MSVKAEVITNEIISHLRSGIVSFVESNRLLLTKFDISKQTFSKYWKIANERHKEELRQEQERIAKESQDSKSNEAKSQRMTRDEVVKMAEDALKLSYNKLAEDKKQNKYNPFNIKTFAVMLDKVCVLQGFNKPDKVAITDPEGETSILRKYIEQGAEIKTDAG